MDALRSVTSWAAYQACEERIKGSLEPGKLADFVILEANPLTVAKETIKDIGISATIVGDERSSLAAGVAGNPSSPPLRRFHKTQTLTGIL